jgi:heat shock protein HspQ
MRNPERQRVFWWSVRFRSAKSGVFGCASAGVLYDLCIAFGRGNLGCPYKQEPGLRPKKAQNTRIRHKSGLCLRVMNKTRAAKFQIGQVVKHRLFPFRGVVFDIDPTFNNTEEWYQSIPAEARPNKDQPFYHLLAENSDSEYIAYVSEQNLLPDNSGEPVRHPQVSEIFKRDRRGNYRLRDTMMH